MQLPLYKRPHVDTQCNAHVYLCDSVLAKKYCLPFQTYTQVCINITSTAVYLLHASFVLTSRIVRIYHYAIPRDYLTTLEKHITPWLWKHQQQWQCFLSNKYVSVSSLLEGITRSATIDTRRGLFIISFLHFFVFLSLICSLCNSLKVQNMQKIIPCPSPGRTLWSTLPFCLFSL